MSDPEIPDPWRYLDTPFALEIVRIERLQRDLVDLANYRRSGLPQRHRSMLAQMFVRLHELRTELMQHPDRVATARGEEDARGETS